MSFYGNYHCNYPRVANSCHLPIRPLNNGWEIKYGTRTRTDKVARYTPFYEEYGPCFGESTNWQCTKSTSDCCSANNFNYHY